MKFLIPVIFLTFIIACDNRNVNSAIPDKHSDTNKIARVIIQPRAQINTNDTVFLNLTKQILTSIKNKDYKQLVSFFHPSLGVRFSPYGYIDTSRHVTLKTDAFLELIGKSNKINWGNYDGSGEEIKLSLEEYFRKFVYNADFLHAEKTSVNKMLGQGNSMNNLETIYKELNYSESYFSGFDKKYEGMDWTCLRLVYANFSDNFYLLAIIHDQWTI